MSELRWNPLLGEWVATATHRQDRTFLPPEGYCPLCPTKPGGFPTEVPESNYEIVVFENRFPSLRSVPEKPTVIDSDLYPVRPAQGMCEVVLYSPDHASSLAREPVEQIYKLVRIWQHGQSCSTRISSNISLNLFLMRMLESPESSRQSSLSRLTRGSWNCKRSRFAVVRPGNLLA